MKKKEEQVIKEKHQILQGEKTNQKIKMMILLKVILNYNRKKKKKKKTKMKMIIKIKKI